MISYEQFQAETRRRKRVLWAKILASEPSGRPAGRRPRDPEQELLLLRIDRARLARREAAGEVVTRRQATDSGDLGPTEEEPGGRSSDDRGCGEGE